MESELKKILGKVAGTIRGLSMDAIEKANSGHPGLPMGCAEIGAYLWGHYLRYNPKNPHWLGRDYFVLSAGHGSMLLYSALHLSGYDLSLDDIKAFRQLHSKTPGHPESGETPGVEVTTGPLGQGVADAVGIALGLKILSTKFHRDRYRFFNQKVIALAGDGCIMEGVSSEASSLAGHLNLDNLILIYDANHVSLDGQLEESCSENTKLRYEAYGWQTFEIDGHDFDALDTVLSQLRAEQTRPVLIVAHTVIGKGSPNRQGSHKAHGEPLGLEELKLAKQNLGLPLEEFYIPQTVTEFFNKRIDGKKRLESEWQATVDAWKQSWPDLAREFDQMATGKLPEHLEETIQNISMKPIQAGRAAASDLINGIANLLPQLYGGSADLSGSDKTMIKAYPLIKPGDFTGRNIKFGVREFAMCGIANGLATTGMILPFVGTFLTFSDYARNAVRLACLMHTHVIYQFTHDSIFLGEDGPTHQPVEHYAAWRAMPHLHFIRPGDNHEVKMAWYAGLVYKGPTMLALTRQNLRELEGTKRSYQEGVGRGGYIVKKENRPPNFTLFASGSELALAVDVATELEKLGKSVRVVSMPCWALFDKQPQSYRDSVIGGNLGIRVAIEAGSELGWHKYIGSNGIAICMSSFGASAPASVLAKEFGFTVESVVERLLTLK